MKSTFFCAALALPFVTLAAPTRYNEDFRLPSKLFRRQDNATCDVASTPQPSSGLNPPPADLSLVLIGLGKGTQNYTCASETATPAAIGAVADIFNASCAVATGNMGAIAEDEGDEVGVHFFIDNTTPDFDIIGLGNTQSKKVQNVTAPNPTADVPWLRLEAVAGAGTTSAVKQIYRLNTEGGVAPATCAGQAPGSVVTVSYSAQYWIYADAAVVEQRRKRRSLGLPLN
jgi:hypothetical protein